MDSAHSLLDKSFPAILQVVLFNLAMVGALGRVCAKLCVLCVPFAWESQNPVKKSHFHVTDFLHSFEASGLVCAVYVVQCSCGEGSSPLVWGLSCGREWEPQADPGAVTVLVPVLGAEPWSPDFRRCVASQNSFVPLLPMLIYGSALREESGT